MASTVSTANELFPPRIRQGEPLARDDRSERLTGRCGGCRYRSICRGGSRVRALAATGDLFAPDPQCYLDEDEISGAEPIGEAEVG